jgi:ACS family sodium-dependent inorganic phosphate cotransporter
MLIAYCDRVNLSVAAPAILKEYGWDTATLGWAFTGFFIGYTGFMIPAGRLTDRIGPKRMFAISIVWWSIFTALTPFPRQIGILVAVRILMGLGESGVMPSMNSILVRWFPKQEYSRATAFAWSGGYAGSIVAFPLASLIMSLWGWQAIFFVFTLLGLLWLPFWWWGVTDRPEESTAISDQELAKIQQNQPGLKHVEAVPWARLLREPALWAAWILHFSSNWFAYVMITWLPTYLSVGRGFQLAEMAFGASLPFVCAMAGSNLFGTAIDRFSRSHDRTRVRKWFMAPYVGAACTLLLVPTFSGGVATVLALCVAMFLMTSATPVYASSSLDMAPRYAGTVVGIQNAIANIAGVLAPVTVGYIVKIWTWDAAFWLTAFISVVGVSTYLVLGRAEKLLD